MTDIEFLTDYLISNLCEMENSSSSGLTFDFPDFELMPFDYLEFAEQEILGSSTASMLGCVANLKRATECEMDTLLHILGLTGKIKSFPKKLDFIREVGLISPRSLDKLNKIRNKMEHEYAIPTLGEIESYFDMATGFVHAIEGYIFMLISHAEQQWCFKKELDRVAFEVSVTTHPPSITYSIKSPGEQRDIEFNLHDREKYMVGMKAFFLLCRGMSLVSSDYVIAKISEKPLVIRSRPV